MASSSHNQQTTANRGGASSIQTPANSGGGGLFGGTSVGAAHDPKGITVEGTHKSTSTDDGKRRTSQESGSLFGNLGGLKRDSADAGTTKRKASMAEQGAQPGIIGSMWKNYTKGS